jgi:hypothetical protein
VEVCVQMIASKTRPTRENELRALIEGERQRRREHAHLPGRD